MTHEAAPAATASRRDLLLGGLLLAASGGAALARPRAAPSRVDPAAFDAAIPARIGPYGRQQADEIVLPDRDGDSLAVYQQYVARTYAAPGLAPVTVLIAYGEAQDYALQLHRPESCYPSSGFTLSPSRALVLPGPPAIDAVTLTAKRIDRQDRLLYWTRVGAAFPASLWGQRWVTLRALLARRVPDGVLVRLSTPDDGPAALATLVGFNALLLAQAGPLARRLMLGRTDARRDQRDTIHGFSTTSA